MTVSHCVPGEVLWRKSKDFGANYTVLTPLSVIPDVDNDGVQDLIIFITKGDQVCHHPEALKTPVAATGDGRNAVYFHLVVSEEVSRGLWFLWVWGGFFPTLQRCTPKISTSVLWFKKNKINQRAGQ